MATVSGCVERVVFRNPDTGFLVARFHLTTTERRGEVLTTIVGTMPSVKVGELLRLSGEWQVHPVHGRNFRVEFFEQELPSTADGIERYLASGAIRGIGPVTAARIVEHFGDQAIHVIDQDPAQLRRVAGISSKRLAVISESWAEQKKIRELMIFLQGHGISVAPAQRIFSTYGERAVEVIERDPYQLAHEVHGVGFRTADTMAMQLGMSRRSESRYVAGLKYALSQATEEGHVFLPKDDLLARGAKLLEATGEELEPALLALLARGDAVVDDQNLYLAPFFKAETGTAQLLRRLVSTPSALTLDRRFDPVKAIAAAAQDQGIVLAEKQLLAAEQALREKASILTGGPGTGKTSTLRTIITALEDADVSYCLCAPTGRAAKRVAETTGRAASTIHRLLEYQAAAGIFGFDGARPLPYEFVVVDEVSMLDTLLFYHLLKAIPHDSHLLLVGDADQLPAVGPGNVLRDLIASEAVPTVTLTELFRQARGSQIVLAAHSVNRGEIPEISNNGDDDLFFVRATTPEAVLESLKRLLVERIPRKFGLDPLEDVQVISPMHLGPVGVSSLNTEIQALLNPPRRGLPEVQRGVLRVRPGDKVMQIRNNYDKDVYNGDVGRVITVRPEEQVVTVNFPAGTGINRVDYEAADLDELVLAYAVSVHKAQGSEFPAIIMPLVTQHYMLLQRNLLYTAITRARRLCVLVGSPRALSVAVNADQRQRRNTQLARRVRQPDPESLQLELA